MLKGADLRFGEETGRGVDIFLCVVLVNDWIWGFEMQVVNILVKFEILGVGVVPDLKARD